jgi:hypothetical protein
MLKLSCEIAGPEVDASVVDHYLLIRITARSQGASISTSSDSTVICEF